MIKHGEQINIESPYMEGDLVKFTYNYELRDETEVRVSYSKIVKVIPKFKKDTTIVELYYLMENKKFVPYVNIVDVEKRAL